ncbi:hypothetical protein WKW79_20510 [Variovorax robiniae]|uniref:Uncharacterized protein n=1 Tax=Variovorax robiniae TaxID=1836199 RepID=A0ABU8XD13_9BURK
MRVNTVLMPIKEKRFNPLTQREELVETGNFQHYAAGKPIGAPIRMPQLAEVPQNKAVPSSALRPQEGYARASFFSPDSRPLAAHYAQQGETAEQAANRLAESASRVEVRGNRATVSTDVYGRPYPAGNGSY